MENRTVHGIGSWNFIYTPQNRLLSLGPKSVSYLRQTSHWYNSTQYFAINELLYTGSASLVHSVKSKWRKATSPKFSKNSRKFDEGFFLIFLFPAISMNLGTFLLPKHELGRSKRTAKFSNRSFEPCRSRSQFPQAKYERKVLSGYFEQKLL